MEVDCDGIEHTQVSFLFRQLEAHSAATTFVEFSIDGIPRETLRGKTIPSGFDDSWKLLIFNVPPDTHTYKFTVETEDDLIAPFLLDTFECRNEEPGPEPNGRSPSTRSSFPQPSLATGSSTTRAACTKVRRRSGRPCPRETQLPWRWTATGSSHAGELLIPSARSALRRNHLR